MSSLASPRLAVTLTAVAAALAVAAPRPAAADAPRRLSLAEAVGIAVGESRAVQAAKESVSGADARVSGAEARRLPKLSADGNVFLWNEAIEFPVPGPPMMPGGEPTTQLITVRGQVTSTVNVTVTQPLSPMIPITKMIRMERAARTAARSDYDAAKLDAADRAAEAYLRVLQAQAARDVAAKSIAQVESNLTRARALEVSGVVGKVDLLRLEAQQAQVKQALLEADAAVRVAKDGLILAVGLPGGSDVEVADDLGAEPGPPPWPAEDALKLALSHRPELRAAAARSEQAARGRDVAVAALYPNLVAIGQYTHSEGSGFSGADSAFVGLSAQWDVWDWGVNRAGIDEAAARTRQAKIGEAALADQIRFEVSQKATAARTAHETLAVSKVGLAAAEEAYRIQTIQFDAGNAVTTDVINAETEVARARIGFALARYQYYVALVQLARAVGELPTAMPLK